MSCSLTARLIKMKADDHDFRADIGSKGEAPLGKDFPALIGLIILVALAVILWFADPSHQPSGESRAEWPPVHPAKP